MRIQLTELTLYLLVLARLAGMIMFNPLLARRNIPAQVRAGLAFFMMLLLSPGIDAAAIAEFNGFAMLVTLFKELGVGLVIGIAFQYFYYLLIYAGDLLDTTFGFSMAKVMDPATNIQTAFTSSLFTAFFTMYFFATGSHLVLIHLFAVSFKMFPIGGALFGEEIARYMIELFIQTIALVIQLALPFIAAEFVLEVCLGILMKVVPQITIFVINFQLKIFLAFIMLILFIPFISTYIDNYIVTLLDTLQRTLLQIGGIV